MSEITIRPGFLVSAATHVSGNQKHRRRMLEYAHIDVDTGAELSRWETAKTVFDPAEQKRANVVANKARYAVTRLCAENWRWLLCPIERQPELDAAIAEAQEMIAEFNRGATYTRVEFSCVYAEIKNDAARTAREVFEVTGNYMTEMLDGLENLDAKKVRAICKKTLEVGQMLAPADNTTTSIAVAAARSACKRIVDAGEEIAIEIDQAVLDTISRARNSFLNFDEVEVQVDVPSATRALEFEAEAS